MTTKELVLLILQNYEEAREKKNHLQTLVWEYEAAENNVTTLDGFFMAYEQGLMSNAETIRRQACKFQEENPELRASEATQIANAQLAEIIRQNRGEL